MPPTDTLELHVPDMTRLEHAPTITSYELKQAIAKLKRGKASGPDNVSPEHLINIGEDTLHLILLIYNFYVTNAHIHHKTSRRA